MLLSSHHGFSRRLRRYLTKAVPSRLACRPSSRLDSAVSPGPPSSLICTSNPAPQLPLLGSPRRLQSFALRLCLLSAVFTPGFFLLPLDPSARLESPIPHRPLRPARTASRLPFPSALPSACAALVPRSVLRWEKEKKKKGPAAAKQHQTGETGETPQETKLGVCQPHRGKSASRLPRAAQQLLSPRPSV